TTLTSATPGTDWTSGWTWLLTRPVSVSRSRLSDETATFMIGWALMSALLTEGLLAPDGSWRWTWATLRPTSIAAALTSDPSAKRIWTRELPSTEVDSIVSMPLSPTTASSSGRVTSASTSSGDAP